MQGVIRNASGVRLEVGMIVQYQNEFMRGCGLHSQLGEIVEFTGGGKVWIQAESQVNYPGESKPRRLQVCMFPENIMVRFDSTVEAMGKIEGFEQADVKRVRTRKVGELETAVQFSAWKFDSSGFLEMTFEITVINPMGVVTI